MVLWSWPRRYLERGPSQVAARALLLQPGHQAAGPSASYIPNKATTPTL